MAREPGWSRRAHCRGPATSGVAAARRADERVVEPAPVPAYLLRPMNHPRLPTGQALTGITDVHIHVQPWRELKPTVLETMWRVGLVNYPSPDVMGFTDASNSFAAK